MSAVLADTRPMMTGLDRSYVNAKLNAWGHWIERHSEVNGYPRIENVTAYLEGAGGGAKGHRVLCVDMPEWIGKTHVRVLYALTEPEQHAVYLWYVVRIKDDGTEWSMDERCERAGISYDTLRRDLNRARYRFLGLEPPY